MFSEKPSCIRELKELTAKLADRDTLMKKDYRLVKDIIQDTRLNNEQKITKIKNIIDGFK